MKRGIFFIIIFVSYSCIVSAQYKGYPNQPFSALKSTPGFITINELTGGIGLSGTSAKYSKYFWGFTSVNGYQINRNFIAGAGIGLSFYEDGLLVPLFLDFRFAFKVGKLTPYLFADGGLLINFSYFDGTNLFINPGVGARYSLNRNFALNLGAGILSQVDGVNRESFANLKLGVVYKF